MKQQTAVRQTRLQPAKTPPGNPGQESASGWWCVQQENCDPLPRDAGKSRAIVISDLHIGTNGKTCWYQKAIHECYLASLFDYVVAHATGVDNPVTRLVILGDLFDFWTYPPDQQPPAIDDIIAANPRILGADGKLSKAVQALRGNVIYLRGNHDIGMTQADLNRLPLGAYQIPLIENDVIVDESGLVLTHGHLFAMFNAPDPRYPGEVPIGHFVSRAIAHMLENTLGAQTAADLPNQGSPYGFDLDAVVPALLAEVAGPSITNLMLDYFAARCGLSETAPILMADGSSTTIAQVKKKYDGLWDIWVARFGGGEEGETIAAKSVKVDYIGDYMAWFAQKTAWDQSARGAVTGHTHVPRQGIANSSCLYLNCGFECPSSPDIAAGNGVFNFGVIDSDGLPALWCVIKRDGMYCVGPVNNTPSDHVVYAPDMDYSCYVTITNKTSNPLERVTQQADHGYYVTYPPAAIAPGATGRFWLQDLPDAFGAEGAATYAPAVGGQQLKFVFGCPTLAFQNYASGGSSFVANSGSAPDSSTPANSVPPYGHPLFADFTVDDGNVAGVEDWTPRSLLALAVDAAGFRYDPRQDIIYSKMYPLQRDFGYAYGYDAAALLMSAIIDCEPIFFDYAGKTWMIELWKGQYGLETGCEIGVYNRTIGSTSFVYGILDATVGKRSGDSNPSHNLFFDCASDSELLLMSSTLYRNGQKVFSRGPEKHWWLTGFKWGLLSEPENLTMDVSIECLDSVMKTALVNSMTGMGYQNLQINGNTVSFTFDTPKTHQPRSDSPAAVSAVRAENQQTVAAYDSLGLSSNDPNTVGDQAAATIGNAFAIYSEEFFGAVITNLANLIGTSVESVIRTLSEGFNITLNAASKFITDAEYGLETWINGIGAWINEVLDFSCVIEISNRGGPYDLVRENDAIGHGNWIVEPPERISAGGAGRFWLQDPKLSPEGSDGLATYSYVDSGGTKRIVMFSFNDPTGTAANTASSSSGAFNLYAKSGNIASAWNPLNSVPGGGHPLYVVFVWGTPPPPP